MILKLILLPIRILISLALLPFRFLFALVGGVIKLILSIVVLFVIAVLTMAYFGYVPTIEGSGYQAIVSLVELVLNR